MDKEALEAIRALLKEELEPIRNDIKGLKEDVTGLKEGQETLSKKIDAIHEQTADLTEFRVEANEKLDLLLEDNKSIYGIIGEHEVAIRTLRRRVI